MTSAPVASGLLAVDAAVVDEACVEDSRAGDQRRQHLRPATPTR